MIDANRETLSAGQTLVALLHHEKNRLEELIQLRESGQLTLQQFDAGLKQMERALRSLRYFRLEPLPNGPAFS